MYASLLMHSNLSEKISLCFLIDHARAIRYKKKKKQFVTKEIKETLDFKEKWKEKSIKHTSIIKHTEWL